MALIALPYDGRKIWINPNLVRSVHQSGAFVVVKYDENHEQLLNGDADDVVERLNKALE